MKWHIFVWGIFIKTKLEWHGISNITLKPEMAQTRKNEDSSAHTQVLLACKIFFVCCSVQFLVQVEFYDQGISIMTSLGTQCKLPSYND